METKSRVKGFCLLFVFLLTFSAGFITTAMAQTTTQSSGPKLKILYPEKDSTITDKEPMIAVEIPKTYPAVDLTSVKVYVDAADVSSLAEVTTEYVLYEVQGPLSDGTHTVRIVIKNLEGTRVDQVTWSFKVSSAAAVAPTPAAQPSGKTFGSFQATYTYASPNLENPASGSKTLLPLEAGSHIEYALNFTNQSSGRSVNVWLNRMVEKNYQATSHDKFRITYIRGNETIVLGDEWTNYSKLSLNSIELRGLKYKLAVGAKEKYEFFAGRTKEGKDNSRYRQYAFGTRGVFTPNSKNTFTYGFMKAYDVGDSIRITSGTVAGPISNTIIALQSAHQFTKAFRLEGQVATNWYDMNTNTSPGETNNAAVNLIGTLKYDLLQLEARYRNIDTYYFPISSSTTMNDKIGTFLQLSLTPSKFFRATWSLDANQDNVDSLAFRNSYDTKNYLLNLTWKPRTNTVSYNLNKYSKVLYGAPSAVNPDTGSYSSGSELDSVTQSWMSIIALPDTPSTTAATVTATYTNSEIRGVTYPWTGPGVAIPSNYTVGSNNTSLTLSGQYKAFLNLTVRHTENYSDTISGTSTVAAHSKEDYAAFQYTFIPFKFIMRGAGTITLTDSYSTTGVILTKVDKLKNKFELGFDYFLTDKKKWTVGVELTDLNDRSTTTGGTQSFTESVWKTSYNWQF